MITSVSCQSDHLRSPHRIYVTIEIRRQCRMVCYASKGIETELCNHELTFSEELEGEAFEQVALNILACEAEVAQLDSGQIG